MKNVRDRLLDLCDGAVLNQCPNNPACEEDDPLPIDDWCGVCLLVHDVRKLAAELPGGDT